MVNKEQVNGSAEIIRKVHKIVGGGKLARGPAQQKWIEWVDDHLVHLLPANLYRTPTESLHSFDYLLVNGNFGFLQTTLARVRPHLVLGKSQGSRKGRGKNSASKN